MVCGRAGRLYCRSARFGARVSRFRRFVPTRGSATQTMRRKALFHPVAAAAAMTLAASQARAQYEVANALYNPSATYYSTATGTGATLKANLNGIIDGNTISPYDN